MRNIKSVKLMMSIIIVLGFYQYIHSDVREITKKVCLKMKPILAGMGFTYEYQVRLPDWCGGKHYFKSGTPLKKIKVRKYIYNEEKKLYVNSGLSAEINGGVNNIDIDMVISGKALDGRIKSMEWYQNQPDRRLQSRIRQIVDGKIQSSTVYYTVSHEAQKKTYGNFKGGMLIRTHKGDYGQIVGKALRKSRSTWLAKRINIKEDTTIVAFFEYFHTGTRFGFELIVNRQESSKFLPGISFIDKNMVDGIMQNFARFFGKALGSTDEEEESDNMTDCGKSGQLTKYVGDFRAHQKILAGFESQIEAMKNIRDQNPQNIINIGNRAHAAGNAYLKTLKSFQRAETRRGLFEELDLLVSTTLTLNEIGIRYRKLVGKPVKPLDSNTVKQTQSNITRTALNLAKQKVAAKFDSVGLRDIITSESWGEALDTAAYHADRKVKEFLERETERIFGLGFYDGPSLRRALQLKMRREIYRQVAKLLVKITSNEIIIELVAGPIIRWIGANLIPRLREALRTKGNLKNRVIRSVATLREARNNLNKLACNAKLRDVRAALGKARGVVHATRYLYRDLRKAGDGGELAKLTDPRGNLERTIRLTTSRFLLDKDDYVEDLPKVIDLVQQILNDLKSALSTNLDDLRHRENDTQKFKLDQDYEDYIPSLQAQVFSLKFFESSPDPIPMNNRRYGSVFSKTTTRSIWWELTIKHPKPAQKLNFKIEAYYYHADGKFLGKSVRQTFIEVHWSSSTHSTGWGWRTPGNWQIGKYQVKATVEGKVVATGEFEIK